MEITKREILFSIIIVSVFFCTGVLISNKISMKHQKAIQEFRSRVQVESSEEFSYCIETDVGGFISEGVLYCSDPVRIPDIPGSYMEIRRVKERYTMHTRVITSTDGKGHTHTRNVIYWSWDEIDRSTWESKNLMFLGQHVSVKIPNSNYTKTIQESSHIRYKYYTTPTRIRGILTGIIEGKKIEKEVFGEGITIEKYEKSIVKNSGVVVFWILWTMFCIGVIVLFYYFENTWLEDKK